MSYLALKPSKNAMKRLLPFSLWLLLVACALPVKAQVQASKSMISSEFINPNAPYPSCHASTIAQASQGHLVASWFGGTKERDPDVGIWVARQEKGKWLAAVEVANGVQKEGPRLPTWNPVLFQPRKGPLVLFYKVGPTPRDWWGMMMTSADGGKTWSAPTRLPDGVLGPIKNKTVELADGSWLSPSSTEGTGAGWLLHFELSRDAGKTWQSIGPVEKNGLDAIQPSVLFYPNGHLQAIARTKNGILASTWSWDGGKRWSPLERTTLPNPNSGTDAVTLQDGRQLLVYNHSAPPPETPSKGLRYPLDVAISDDGKDWRRVVTLETEPKGAGYAYPAVVQAKDGKVHITYTWDRKMIKHVVLDPKKLDGKNAPPAEIGAEKIATTLRVRELQCEFDKEPLGVDVAKPRLFWQVESRERGQRQSAYRLLVASTPGILAENRGDLWDSGRVASAQTTHVSYNGKQLSSSQRVFWKVQSWDKDGIATPWSSSAAWTMGVLTQEEWKGAWIVGPSATESLLLRRDFAVKAGLKRAVVHVCGLGQFEMRLNGSKVGDALLSPGWTDFSKTTLYSTFEVTNSLKEGQNAVGIALGNGMYNVVRRDRFVKFTGSFGALRAILQLRLEYQNGDVEFVGTDRNWRTSAGPQTYNNIYGGEDYDARLEPDGWSKAGFDDKSWKRAVLVTRPSQNLHGYSADSQPLRAIESRVPVALRTYPDGSVLYDMGQNASYMPRVTISGPAGSAVRLIPSEVLHADGTINPQTMGQSPKRGNSWWQFTKATDGEETYFPKFFYIGCRYLKAENFAAEVDGDPGTGPKAKIENLEGVVVHADTQPVGKFAASNELLNQTRDLVRWAQRSNMVSVLTDCPHREKLGWLEQYHLNGPAIRYEYDTNRIFTKGLHDMQDAQDSNGNVPTTAPDYAHFSQPFHAATEWGSAVIIVPWQQYEFTGDKELLASSYDSMKKYFAYLETRAKQDILSEGLGDWYDIGPAPRPGAAQLTPPEVTSTAFFYHDAVLLNKIALLLGKEEDAKNYATRADSIYKAFNTKFFDAKGGFYATNSQTSNALPLVFELVPEQERPRVLAALIRDVESRGYAVTAGDIGFRFLLQALATNGRSDVIYKMVCQSDKPGYAYQLKQGATALTEAWDANQNASHNHFMLGQITEWFYKDLVGIESDPQAPGFEKILLRPQPVGDLKWAEAAYNSVRGPIQLRWERDEKSLKINVTVPANTAATLFWPKPSGATKEIQEGGKPLSKSAGVKVLRNDTQTVLELQAGEYQLEGPK